nr:MAG TPA: hypothetical protein [Ackermannviridae sp.]
MSFYFYSFLDVPLLYKYSKTSIVTSNYIF